LSLCNLRLPLVHYRMRKRQSEKALAEWMYFFSLVSNRKL